jgi:hypothetical protein
MPWLCHFALFVVFVAALFRPAAAGAFVSAPDAGSQARVGAFELVTATLVGPASAATCRLHEGIGAAYDENASGYRFAARGGARPPNLSPPGAGRNGAFREAKRQSEVPVSQQPSRVSPNLDRRGNVQPGKIYEFEVPAPGGGTRTVRIRDDAAGHDFGPGDPQNRGPHFNDEAGNHYDY